MLLAKQNIPFASLTLFQARLQVKARRQLLLSAMYASVGEANTAQVYQNIGNHLMSLSANKTVSNNLGALAFISTSAALNSQVDGFVKSASINGVKPAIDLRVPLSGLEAEDYALTAAQRNACENNAYNQAFSEGFTDRTPELEQELLQRVGTLAGECRDRTIIENIVNLRLEDSGTALLYATMDDTGLTFKNQIANKRFEQKKWVGETADSTGLSYDIINDIVANGVLNQLNQEPSEVKRNLVDSIKEPGTVSTLNGLSSPQQVLSEASILLIKLIVSSVLSAVTAAIALMNAIKQQRQNVYDNITDPDLFKPLEEDFNGNGIGDDSETFLQSLLAPANLGLALSLGLILAAPVISKENKNIIRGIGALGTLVAGYFIINPNMRWLVGGQRLSAQDLADRGFVNVDGEWYFAEAVSGQTNGQFSASDIINGGIELYTELKGTFDLVKELFGTDTSIFIGNDLAVNAGDV